jgi:hypothetical protein
MENCVAILTGDLIGSTKAGAASVDQAMNAIKQTSHWLSEDIGEDTRFTRSRGDGWQIYLSLPGMSLRACLLINAGLRALDIGVATRISVGIGDVTWVGETLSDAFGDAFNRSGRGLDEMNKATRLLIAGSKTDSDWHTAIFDLVAWQSRKWSREQAEAIMIVLKSEPSTHTQMAETLGITRQAFQARLNSAGYPALKNALWAFEKRNYQVSQVKDTA